MKRLIAFAVIILTAVCITACSVGGMDNTSKENGLNTSFQAAVTITLENLTAEGTIKRFGDGMWEAEFASPNTLSGVKLSFDGGNVNASYKGLNFSVPQSALPVKSMLLNLISAVDDLAKNEELTGTDKDGKLEISGSLEGGEYILTVDENGKISSFEMPNNKLNITFTDVVPIDGGQQPTDEGTIQPSIPTDENATAPITEAVTEITEATETTEAA